jgi:hypothetical protein
MEQLSVVANGQQESSLGRGIVQAMSTKRDMSLISRLQDNIYGGVIVN